MEIQGARAVVVGGASGMGRASAELLAARGAKVVVVDRPPTAGRKVAAGLGGYLIEGDVPEHAPPPPPPRLVCGLSHVRPDSAPWPGGRPQTVQRA
ncbi:SDR family NAD(P)-dependent oxidoreductase [Nocardia carnea]|uniref:SDR family NAD(P)-dependent oxidoreductase n=1 Tax=Nocardia carnea TaxID=37328 RepID=UPI003D782FAF